MKDIEGRTLTLEMPQNIQAEESVLGAILLDPDTIARVADILPVEAFSLVAHRKLYAACLQLFRDSKPTDLMTVTTYLCDRKILHEVGGQEKIASLVYHTVSSVNCENYANLIIEKWMSRQLIQGGDKIKNIGYEPGDFNDKLDQAEEILNALSGDRKQEGLTPLANTLVDTYQEIEDRSNNKILPGYGCGLYDLDTMTGGFSRSDLIIVAGRPSMGKTAFAIQVSQAIAKNYELPVAIFSLEMSKEQLAARMLGAEARVESNRLRTGEIGEQEWGKLSSALGKLSEIPIHIDDTSSISVTTIRTRARQLAKEGGQLGLIMIDYLQLMGGDEGNRVQELSRITRQFKGLARELNVPVMALSQLNRSVEARNNKRPMMSDLRDSGCLTGDSLVTLADSGAQAPIRNLVGKSGFAVWALNESTMKLERAIVSKAFSTGFKPVLRLVTRLGRTIKATANHKFLTINGWKRLDELKPGLHLALPRCLPSPSVQSMTDAARLADVVKSDKIALLSTSDVYWDRIISIEPDSEAEVYDLTVPGLHNFVADDVIVHNSIEQDADLILMLYRDEYYNEGSAERGIAEVIITKHRNGPTGTVKFLFDAGHTSFRNLVLRG